MYKYQITIDLFSNKSDNFLNDLLDNIGENKEIFRSAWLVKSNLRPSNIQGIISDALDKKDYYTVLEIGPNAGSIIFLPQEQLDWLNE